MGLFGDPQAQVTQNFEFPDLPPGAQMPLLSNQRNFRVRAINSPDPWITLWSTGDLDHKVIIFLPSLFLTVSQVPSL